MRKILFLVTIIMLFVSNTLSCEAKEKILAIIPLEDVSAYDDKYADINPAEMMTDELTSALYKSGEYEVIERNKVDSILEEMGFPITGFIDPSRAAEIGRLMKAEYVVIGKVTTAKLSAAGKMLGLKSNTSSFHAKINLNYRMVDVKTGEILCAGVAKGESYGEGDGDTVMYEACQNAARDVLRGVMVDLKATIAEISSDRIYIDGGSRLGFTEGENLIAFRETKPIEINGKIVGVEEIKLGTVKVIEVKDDYAVCKITKQNGGIIQKGDFVKRAKKKK